MHNKKAKIPCLFSKAENIVSSNLVPVNIVLMHDMINRNNTHISVDTIKRASESIKNKPILAYMGKNEYGELDFAGHEIIVELSDDSDELVKVTYLESPIGIIPESTDINYFEKDGKTYMTCTGYIYSDYSNDAIGLIEKTDGKCVSVEININNFSEGNDGVLGIDDFEFTGVTILSDDVRPAMDENCRIEIDNGNTINTFMDKAIKDVYEFENPKKQKNNPLGAGLLDDEPENPDDKDEPDETDPSETEPDETDKSGENGKVKPEEPDEDDKNIEGDDGKTSVEDGEEETADNGEDDTTTLDDVGESDDGVGNSSEFSVFSDLLGNDINTVSSDVELKGLIEELIDSKDRRIEELEVELGILIDYKNNNEKILREEEVQSILNDFDVEIETEVALIQKALDFEISVDDFKKELYALVGKNVMSSKKTKRTDKALFEGIRIHDKNKDKKTIQSSYGGLFDNLKL